MEKESRKKKLNQCIRICLHGAYIVIGLMLVGCSILGIGGVVISQTEWFGHNIKYTMHIIALCVCIIVPLLCILTMLVSPKICKLLCSSSS